MNRFYGFCFHYYCADYECKYSDTLWLAGRVRVFVQYTISLSSLCKLILGHWTYEMPVRYILWTVWVRLNIFSQLSIIQYMGLYVFSLPVFLVMIEIIWTLSYYHHQIGSMNYYPLFRAKSWDNGMRCMSLYIIMIITRIIDFNDKFQKYCHGAQFGWGYCEILITLVTSGLACRSCTTTLIKWHVYWFMGMIGLMHIVAVFRYWLMLCLWPVVVLVSGYKLYRMRCCQNITWLVLLCC